MDRFEHHFVDACAIIGRLLEFDAQYDHAVKYFKKKFKRHTSNGVADEVTNRLNQVRMEILGFIEWIKREQFTGLQTDERIYRFIKRYRLVNNTKKNRNMLDSFYMKYLNDIKSFILENNLDYINEIQKTVVDAIGSAQNNFSYLTKFNHENTIKTHDCPEYYSGNKYGTKYSEVEKAVNYHPDTKVLLDSFYVKDSILKTDLGFITTDSDHIISNKSKIEELLTGMFIFDMRSVKTEEAE